MRVELPEKFLPLFDPCRYKVYYGGRGAAKTWSFARALLLLGAQRKHTILCVREFQVSIADSVKQVLENQIEELGLGDFYTVTDKEISGANGTVFLFKGLRRNVQSIKSTEGVTICWVEEAQTVSDTSWEVLIPTIREEGSEIWISFNTGIEEDPTYKRFVSDPPEGALVVKVGWRDNPWFTSALERERQELWRKDRDRYDNVWEGMPRVFSEGSIYGKILRQIQDEGQICKIPVVPSVEVNTFWDLGKGDATAIWFHQRVGKEDRFIDYYENRLEELDHYIRMVKRIGQDRKFNYGRHFLPHDVTHKLLGMKKTRKRVLEEGGVRPITVVPKTSDIHEGIALVRDVLPSCFFDERGWTDENGNEQGVARGLKCLRHYRMQYDPDRMSYRPEPVHDWASDGADAFRQFAQGYTEASAWGTMPPVKMDTRGVV